MPDIDRRILTPRPIRQEPDRPAVGGEFDRFLAASPDNPLADLPALRQRTDRERRGFANQGGPLGVLGDLASTAFAPFEAFTEFTEPAFELFRALRGVPSDGTVGERFGSERLIPETDPATGRQRGVFERLVETQRERPLSEQIVHGALADPLNVPIGSLFRGGARTGQQVARQTLDETVLDSADQVQRTLFRFDRSKVSAQVANQKPQGIYLQFTNTPVEGRVDEFGDVITEFPYNPMNPLVIQDPPSIMHRRGAVFADEGFVSPSAGVAALRELAGPEEFERLRVATKPQLIAELNSKFPGLDYNQAFDSYELLEMYGAQLARRSGIDAIELIDTQFPDLSEVAVLSSDAISSAGVRQVGRQLAQQGTQRASRISLGEITDPEAFMAAAEGGRISQIVGPVRRFLLSSDETGEPIAHIAARRMEESRAYEIEIAGSDLAGNRLPFESDDMRNVLSLEELFQAAHNLMDELGADTLTGIRLGTGRAQTLTREQVQRRLSRVSSNIGENQRFLPDDVPSFGQTLDSVFTSENPILRQTVGRGINPSIRESTPVGRGMIAYVRQRNMMDGFAEDAVSAANDVHVARFTGRMNEILPIDDDGIWRGLGKHWNDVWRDADSLSLTPAQRAYRDDMIEVVQETNQLLLRNGLQPIALDDLSYFPRQGRGSAQLDFPSPSSARLQRVFEDATEGVGAGIRYVNNPREVLLLHVRARLREIADRQFSDYLSPLGLTPTQLIAKSSPELVANKLATRRAQLQEVVRLNALFRAKQRINVTGPSQSARRLRSARRRRLQNIDNEIEATRARLVEARRAADQAKRAYSAEMKRLSQSSIQTRSEYFGGAPDKLINVRKWTHGVGGGRFFPSDQTEALERGMNNFFGRREINWWLRRFEDVGNYSRFLSAVGDFAAPLTHGLPLLFSNPVRWGRATALHYYAFADPTVLARYTRNNLDTFQEMRVHGVPVTANEFFEAIQRGNNINVRKLVERLPKGNQIAKIGEETGRQTIGRFQASYDTMLTAMRAELWQANRHKFNDLNQLAQYVRNMTGGLDSSALGVGRSQRAVESLWLAFSPRLLRSTVALLGDALRPNTAAGRAALRSLVQLMGGAIGIYVLTGWALGKTQEEITTGLTPTSGKRFLSHEINGDHIGFGGQIRALAQAIGGIAATLDPDGDSLSDLWNRDLRDNPLLAFWASRGAPALNVGGALAEGLSGGNINALPYEEIDSLPDLGKHIGTSALPFAVQGILEGQQPLTSSAGFSGLRTSGETLSELKDRKAREFAEALGMQRIEKIGDLPPRIQADITAQADAEFGGRRFEPRDEFERIREIKEEQATKIQEALDAGVSGDQLRQAIQDARREIAIRSDEIITDELEKSLADRDLTRLQVLREKYWTVEPAGNIITNPNWFEEREQLQASVLNTAMIYGVNPEWVRERAPITENQRVQRILDQYDSDMDVLKRYWRISDDAISLVSPQIRELYEEYRVASPPRQAAMLRRAPIIGRINNLIANRRRLSRMSDSEVDTALVRWGFSGLPRTAEGRQLTAADILSR